MLSQVVLDVGCGTGILSLFAAEHGARLVCAVDCADIARLAAGVVRANHYEHIIKVFHAKIEDVQLPVRHVDIIISEWMGYCLLFESMLDSVLFARDKWLKPGGLLLPDRCSLYVTGISCTNLYNSTTDFWTNVWDFDMRAIRDAALSEARIMSVDAELVATNVFRLKCWDLNTVQRKQLRVATPFRLKMMRDDHLHGFATHFDVEFRCDHHLPTILTTSPHHRTTHWKQTAFFLPSLLAASAGEYVYGTFRLAKNRVFHRSMDVSVDVAYRGANATVEWQRLPYTLQ